MSNISVKYKTTAELEKEITAIEALSKYSEERENAFDSLLFKWPTEKIYSWKELMAIDNYLDGKTENVIPEAIDEDVRIFLASFPPLICWRANKFKSSRTVGKSLPIFEEFNVCGRFLTESDVAELKNLSRFIQILDAQLKQLKELEALEQLNSVPAPKNFFARWRKVPEDTTLIDKIELIESLKRYVNIWLEVLDHAAKMKTGILMYEL